MDYLRDKTRPYRSTRAQLAKAFHVSVNELAEVESQNFSQSLPQLSQGLPPATPHFGNSPRISQVIGLNLLCHRVRRHDLLSMEGCQQ